LGFFASARAGQLPNVSFIDPRFIEYPPDGDCDGPPADISKGQAFVQQVVEAVVSSPAWNKTLLLIVYDEHGGFYDHVPPSAAAPFSDDLSIKTHGVRVPAFVISPWVGAGTVFGSDEPPVGPGQLAEQAVDAAPSRSDLHFDHTSILKTIARRFLSSNPPYMGARYAAANDLSMVVGTQLQQPQFLPFIRYRLQFVRSQMMLAVNRADLGPSAVVWQLFGNGTLDQDFSFEDAGNGFVYIRSHVGNLYMTAQIPHPVLTGGTAASTGASDAPPLSRGLLLEVKYPTSRVTAVNATRPELQRWKLSPASVSTLDRNLFVISNEAYQNMVLQPTNPSQPESTVVLTVAGAGVGIHPENANAWRVTSPLLSDPVVPES
jgi:hypothetical protein